MSAYAYQTDVSLVPAIKNGRDDWDKRTVIMVDEAAMLGTRVTGELLAAARQAGAKVILAGDDRQLASSPASSAAGYLQKCGSVTVRPRSPR